MKLSHDMELQIRLVTVAILALLALTINLGMLPFIGDEALRSLVAIEMEFRNNYLVPTTNGQFYFSKPPLYNWILLFFFKLFGSVNEWTARIPTVFFTLSFSLIIYKYYYHFTKKKYDAIIIALMFLTCGRILFWDSFLGLIDIFFSLVMFVMFMEVFRFGKQEKNNYLFFTAYALTLVGFMLKGFPAPVFLFFTMLAYCFSERKWRFLISKSHVLSLFLFGSLLGLFYYFYNQHEDASRTVAPLLEQATGRTVLHQPIKDVLLHLFTYPFENIYHFLPWSIFTIFFLRKDFFKVLREHRFFNYVFWCFIFNIFVYWISPVVYPRYILMLVPLIFGLFMYFHGLEDAFAKKVRSVMRYLFSVVLIILPLGLMFSLTSDKIQSIPNAEWKVGVLTILLSVNAYFYWKDKKFHLMHIVISVLILRIFFDLFIMPLRNQGGQYVRIKKESIEIAKKYKPLKVYQSTRLYFNNLFYISNTNKELITKEDKILRDQFYVMDSSSFLIYKDEVIKVDSLIDGAHQYQYFIVEKKD